MDYLYFSFYEGPFFGTATLTAGGAAVAATGALEFTGTGAFEAGGASLAATGTVTAPTPVEEETVGTGGGGGWGDGGYSYPAPWRRSTAPVIPTLAPPPPAIHGTGQLTAGGGQVRAIGWVRNEDEEIMAILVAMDSMDLL